MKLEEENLTLLKSALKKGDKSAFKTFYEMYYEGLFFYINSLTKDKAITQDILQETFIKLWNNRSQLDVDKSIKKFLYSIAHNLFIDFYRKKRLELKMLDSLVLQAALEKIDQNEELKKARLKKLKKAIEGLSPRCQEIFRMSKFQGYKYQEIADSLGISRKTVEVQMGKALSILREAFKKND